MSDDFYIGYRKAAPTALANFVRSVAIGLVLVVIAIAAITGAMQRPAGNGHYNFGESPVIDAVLRDDPVLLAFVDMVDGGPAGDQPALLVAQGKHGAPSTDFTRTRTKTRFTGARIERDGVRMIEIGTSRDMELAGTSIAKPQISPLGNVSMEGELIDLKCYLGVMNPASGKVHRGCAALCLRGGVPAGLAATQANGSTKTYALNFRASGAPALNPEWAGRIVKVSGMLENVSGLPVLSVREMALR